MCRYHIDYISEDNIKSSIKSMYGTREKEAIMRERSEPN